MSDRRLSLAAIAASIVAALALWVSFGTLAFGSTDRHAEYVGLLPSPVWLAVLVALALVAVRTTRVRAVTVLPLWLSAVLLLPWLPVPVPLSAFIWTGQVKVWLWVIIAAAILLPSRAGRRLARVLEGASPRQSAIAAALIALVVYGFGAWALAKQHPGGDEPHYLVIAQSLILDHDLRIENNHTRGDYAQYYDGPLKPDFLHRGTNGEIYSIHAPGLPLLVAPVFAAFGYRGVVVSLVVASAAGSALSWLVAWRVTRSRAASWFGWASVSFSAPFFLHASAIYPDGLAAIVMLVAVLPLVDARARTPTALVAIGAALGLLPWLHTRFAVLAGTAALTIAGRVLSDHEARIKRLASLAVVPSLSALAWLLFFRIVYGTFDPAAPYGGVTNTSAGNIVRGIPGLLFDQQFGLLCNAPVLLCAILGLGALLRHQSRRLALELTAICGPYFLVVAFFYMWWGGFSAPARFLVPLTLLLAVPIAAWFASRTSITARVAGMAASSLSLAVTTSMVMAEQGGLSINVRDGASRLLSWLSPVVDLTTAFPSLFQTSEALAVDYALVWLAALTAAVVFARMVETRMASFDRDVRIVVAILTFGLAAETTAMAATSVVWRSNRATVVKPDAAAWALVHQFAPESQQLAVAYRPVRRLRLRDLLDHVTLTTPVPGADHEWSAMLGLPPGTFEVTGTSLPAPEGAVRVVMDSESTPIAQWPVSALTGSWRQRFTLPVGVRALRLDLDAPAKRAVRNLTVRVVSVLARKDRLAGDPEAERVARYGPAVVFLLGGSAWVEPAGTWVAGGRHAEFAISPDGATPIRLFVRNGATTNTVSLESGAWHRDLALAPGEEHLLDVPSAPNRSTTALRVESAQGFRPAEVDPHSQDQRVLGVWIETR